ncbi:BLOC-2 complex member HPS3 [Eucyclogobius newberryi]|uniref:BLOC-2 complex member HPS3 n=1 Tax=Eucyclogobius newberryi TaxID=166745 RepID=UPI003B59BFE5
MVHVYNCHPFSSQQIVQVEQEPGLVCCGGGALFVVATGGCKVEAYDLEQDACPLICRFATMGTVKSIRHSTTGDYLVTIEEKNSATYLRAYTNWRYQAEEKARVGVRLLGHLLRGASPRGGVQMEIIEIPMSERPVAVACCSVTGDLLVACENTLVLFNLKLQNQQSPEGHAPLSRQNQQNWQNPAVSDQQSSNHGHGSVAALDFDRAVILHLSAIKAIKVALCVGYVALQSELEVLVLKLEASDDPSPTEETPDQLRHDDGEEQTDFFVLPRHQELLGERAKSCDVHVSVEKTGLEDGGQCAVSYVLFRRFSPEFFQGCNVDETQIHSLQFHPLFLGPRASPAEDPACVFCFFSLPNAGYLYSLKGSVELISAYQYPEKVLEAVLTDHLLHVVTRNALQCFTVRCAALAARMEDPYIDTTMKACPPCSLDVCALRMQSFIGLRSICVFGRRVVLLSRTDGDACEAHERTPQRRGLELKEHTKLTGIFLAVGIDPTTSPALESLLARPFLSRKWAASTPKEPSAGGHGWNLYVVNAVTPIELYQEMVEYSQSYSEANPQAQSLRHLLSEAHLLLRASLLARPRLETEGRGREREEPETEGRGGESEEPETEGQEREEPERQEREEPQRPEREEPERPEREEPERQEREELEAALRENCAHLGDCFSRGSQRDCHLALPYYRMSSLSIPEVMSRNRPHPGSPRSYGPGFLFYLKHCLLEETQQVLHQDAADEVIDIFSQSEPSQLVGVCSSPIMVHASPARTLQTLGRLEDSAGVSVALTVTMATLALRLDDPERYGQLMDRHSEMLLVYAFIEEPRLLLHGAGGAQHAEAHPTALALEMARTQPGLLVAALVALHENGKVTLEQANRVFKELGRERCLQVDFWEGTLMASSQEPVIQELLFRVASVYVERLTHTNPDPKLSHPGPGKRPLKSADDLIGSCSHFGPLHPWLSVLCPVHITNSQHQEALHKLQSLLCGPSLYIGSVGPLLEQISEDTLWGFSLHLLCATRRGHYNHSIEKLLDRCPQAIIAYANHHLQDRHTALWWQKLLPELCSRARGAMDNSILLAALQETLVVVSMETSPTEFLELIPDDGTAAYFVPHLLTCTQRPLNV